MYDKTSHPPKAGSLKEALFLHVWLKRQEQDIARLRVLAQGMASGENTTLINKAFKTFVNTIFPFSKDVEEDGDKQLIERMRKEAAMGRIEFSTVQESPLVARAKTFSKPDEFRKKLSDAVAAKRGRQ